jgi:hypothetical protein
MPRTCTICTHTDCPGIEQALSDSLALRTIAARWSVSKTALLRHRDTHLRTVPDMPQSPQERPPTASVPQALLPATRVAAAGRAAGAPAVPQAQRQALEQYYAAIRHTQNAYK